jgi:hypothetical protein
MKTQKSKFARLMPGLTTISIAAAALCLTPSSASGKPPHGGGSGGGLPYPTASTVSQLIADINYANRAGGAVTINLAPGAIFDLKSADNTTDGGNGLPVIGGTTALNLIIRGNGATINRIARISRYYTVENPFRLVKVSSGASLTLDQITLKGGWSGSGGGILNEGTLNISNGCTLSGNTGGIYNNGGIVTVRDSTLWGNNSGSGAGISNVGGTVTVSDSVLSGNSALYNGGGIYSIGGTVTVSSSTLSGNSARFGGGIYNSGATLTLNYGSIVTDNVAFHADYPWAGGDGGGLYNDGGLVTINNSTLSGNSAVVYFGTGGGIYNKGGAVAVENYSSITENTNNDVDNRGLLYLDNTSPIGILDGNSAIPF